MPDLIADYSYISALAHCGRFAYYRHERGLTNGDQSVYLVAGSALHAGIDHLYTQNWDIEGALDALRASWGDYVTPATIRANWLTLGHCEIILQNYAEDRFGEDIVPIRLRMEDINHDAVVEPAFQVDPDGFVSLVETPLSVHWPDAGGATIPYAGKIDLPSIVAGTSAIVDHKTSSQWITEKWAEQYAMSHQFRGYKAILEILTGQKFDRVYINGIYTGKEAADDPSKWKKRTSVRSALFGPYIYSKQHLEETREWVENWLKTAEFYRELNWWPQNDRVCFKFGRPCEYYDLCKRAPHIRESAIKQEYKIRQLTGILASGADSND
jgi:hypothetical protein